LLNKHENLFQYSASDQLFKRRFNLILVIEHIRWPQTSPDAWKDFVT